VTPSARSRTPARGKTTAVDPSAAPTAIDVRSLPPYLGQHHAREDLAALLEAGRLPPALILHGPAGVGKMTLARRLAALLLDPDATPEMKRRLEPATTGRVAELLAGGSHPDLHAISKHRCADSRITALRDRKQTNIPLDLLRELMLGGEVDGARFESPVQRSPYLGHAKVFLIDEAELLDNTGQNALLKTLEEPPPATWIVLVVTERARLLPTIRSRCHQVAFQALSDEEVGTWLDRRSPAPSGDLRRWLLDFADGSPGRAQLAIEAGLIDWQRTLEEPFEQVAAGGTSADLADAMTSLVKAFAEARVKSDPKASKEAANRLGSRLVLGLLGRWIGRRLVEAARHGEVEATERWATWLDRLDLADQHVGANVGLSHAFADLAAAWAGQPAAATRGRR